MNILPQITVSNQNTDEKRNYRIDQDRLTIGRSASNDIPLASSTISRHHAEILREGDQHFLRDMGSGNGTLLNGKRIPPKDKVLLRSGDVFQIETYALGFDLSEPKTIDDLHEATDTDVLEIKMVKKLIQAMDKGSAPSLEILEGSLAGTRFVFEGKNQEVTIGRDPACEFAIDSEVISRKHARAEKRYDTIILRDLGSKNGTYVNREKITEKKLQDSDIIHLGVLALRFRNPQELSLDLDPPKVPKISEEAPESKPPSKKDEPQKNTPSSSQNTPTKEEASSSQKLPPAESRGSRRSKNQSKKKGQQIPKKSKPSPPPPQPEELPPPSDMGIDEGLDVPFDSAPESAPAPGFLNFFKTLNLSTSEIIAVVTGFLVLIGSIWGLMKLF